MQHPTEAQHKQDATTANAPREPRGSNNVVISLSREYGSGGREIDEKPFSRLLLNPNRFLSGSDGYPLAQQIHTAEIDLVRSLTTEGPCVIVGRCVDSILAEHPGLVRLFVSAPMEDRVARVMRRNGLDEEQARARIARTDKERASYYRYFTDQKWGLASNYDLCINSAMASIDGTVDVIARFLERRQASQ